MRAIRLFHRHLCSVCFFLFLFVLVLSHYISCRRSLGLRSADKTMGSTSALPNDSFTAMAGSSLAYGERSTSRKAGFDVGKIRTYIGQLFRVAHTGKTSRRVSLNDIQSAIRLAVLGAISS